MKMLSLPTLLHPYQQIPQTCSLEPSLPAQTLSENARSLVCVCQACDLRMYGTLTHPVSMQWNGEEDHGGHRNFASSPTPTALALRSMVGLEGGGVCVELGMVGNR